MSIAAVHRISHISACDLIDALVSLSGTLHALTTCACRFASAFTLGSGLIMASFFALKGFRPQLAHMLDKDRLLFSIGAPRPARLSPACSW